MKHIRIAETQIVMIPKEGTSRVFAAQLACKTGMHVVACQHSVSKPDDAGTPQLKRMGVLGVEPAKRKRLHADLLQ